MKDQSKKKRFAKLFSQNLPSSAVFKCGLALLIICTVAAFVMAYYHDAYSSILELKELAATDVWFKLFVILMVLGAALLVGSPLLAMTLAGITLLSPTKESEVIDEQSARKTLVIKDALTIEEKASATEQPERVIINEARLRDIFNSEFMHEWIRDDGTTYLDQLIKDLQAVRDHYLVGSKKGEELYAAKHIFEIASLLYKKNKYFRKVYGSYADWCRILFPCLLIDGPNEGSIKKYQVYSSQVKKRFYYLL